VAAPAHPTVQGKALAFVPSGGGGGLIQPIHMLQDAAQSSITMVRVVTGVPPASNPPNGYSAPSMGGTEGNTELRGTLEEVLLSHVM